MESKEQPQEGRDIFREYWDRQKFEHELINRKTTWLLTTQTIIFAAYGVTFKSDGTPEGADHFRGVIAWSGLAIAVIVLAGVIFLIRSKWGSFKEYRDEFGKPASPTPPPPYSKGLQFGLSTLNTYLTLLPDLLLPGVFIVAWLVLIF